MINNDLPKVSIVIPCYNAQKTIAECLDGLKSQDYPSYEIIVIDDNSNDKTLEILQKSNGIKVLRNESNHGPAYSRNRAIQEATGEMMLLIDSDNLVEDRKLIYKHILAHRRARADIIGGGIQGIGRGPVAKADNYCHWFTNKPYSDNRMTTHLVTNNMSMKRMVFENIGGFNEALKAGEDVDFCERAIRAGYTLGLCTDAVVKHRDRESLREFIKNFYIVGINKIQARRVNRYLYWYLLPFDFLSSLLYWIPLGFLISIYIIYSWFRYDKKVILYFPFIFLAGFAHASGVVCYFFKEKLNKNDGLMNKKVVFFLRRQFKELKDDGVYALGRKFYTFIMFLLAPLGVMIMRLLRPFVVIRFGAIIASRIGHFAADIEIYLCERSCGMHPAKTIDIFYLNLPICNYQLKKMWARKLRIFNFVRPIDRLNRLLPGGKIHQISFSHSDLDIRGLMAYIPAHLSFTSKEECFGREAMRKLGIPENKKILCFYSRDSAYLNKEFPNQNWHYHNHRDSNIHNFLPAVERLVKRGYFAIRMGAVVRGPLKSFNPQILDYATNARTDFLDIFLSAKCDLFLSDIAGLNAVPRIFRRPTVYVNCIPLGIKILFSCLPGSLFIPKRLRWRNAGRFLTITEIISLNVDNFYHTSQYENLGIEVIENTPEEISSVTIEMEERLRGVWQTTGEDEKLQEQFWFLIKQNRMDTIPMVRIGADFLKENREMLV